MKKIVGGGFKSLKTKSGQFLAWIIYEDGSQEDFICNSAVEAMSFLLSATGFDFSKLKSKEKQ